MRKVRASLNHIKELELKISDLEMALEYERSKAMVNNP